MKIGYLKLLITCILLIMVFTVNTIFDIFSLNMLVLFLLFILVILKLLVGFEKDRTRYRNDVILMILICVFGYYILTYLSGLFLGFNLTGYSLKIINIFKNTTPILFLIIVSELIRYTFVIKGCKYKSILVLTAILFIILDITIVASGFIFADPSNLLKFSMTILLPAISKNIMLTYVSYKAGYKPAIIYRLLVELPIYFLPIFPALGIYIESVLKLLFPAYIMYDISSNFSKIDNTYIPVRDREKGGLISTIVLVTTLVTFVILNSGMFKYYILSVGSASMEPTINIGDAVLVKKLNSKKIAELEVNQILIFKYDKIVVVHRIVDIKDVNGTMRVFTKGDNNEAMDRWVVTEKDIIGTASFKIPFLGYPSVWLNELITKKG